VSGGAATYAAYKQSLADGRVTKNDRVMLFNCATGLKYPLPPVTRTLDRHSRSTTRSSERHCERSEAIHCRKLDCFVACSAMTIVVLETVCEVLAACGVLLGGRAETFRRAHHHHRAVLGRRTIGRDGGGSWPSA
jgi:hypothetical protein